MARNNMTPAVGQIWATQANMFRIQSVDPVNLTVGIEHITDGHLSERSEVAGRIYTIKFRRLTRFARRLTLDASEP
jgi:hypothetical protein